MMVRQMIAVTIAACNDCNYYQDLQGNTLSMLGLSTEVITSLHFSPLSCCGRR